MKKDRIKWAYVCVVGMIFINVISIVYSHIVADRINVRNLVLPGIFIALYIILRISKKDKINNNDKE